MIGVTLSPAVYETPLPHSIPISHPDGSIDIVPIDPFFRNWFLQSGNVSLTQAFSNTMV